MHQKIRDIIEGGLSEIVVQNSEKLFRQKSEDTLKVAGAARSGLRWRRGDVRQAILPLVRRHTVDSGGTHPAV